MIFFGVETEIFGWLLLWSMLVIYLAGRDLDRIRRSLQARRLNRLARGKYGKQGIMVCMITESAVIIPWWGTLASPLLCFKEDVPPCSVLVVPFYVVSFYYLTLTGLSYSAFRGRWTNSSSLSVSLLPQSSGGAVTCSVLFCLFLPHVYSQSMPSPPSFVWVTALCHCSSLLQVFYIWND